MAKNKGNIYFWLRLIREFSVPEVAEKLRVSEAYIRAIEKGDKKPSVRLRRDFSELYKVDENIIERFEKEKELTTVDKFLLELLKFIAT